MKNKLYIFLLPALLCLAGCRDSRLITDSLNRAEAWMEEHPDSARAALSALSFDEIRQSDNRARYALLYTQMQDKNYMDETDDSLISVAADYYRHTDDVRRRFLSCYYKGKVLFNGGNHLNAMSYYMEAEQLADAVNDGYLVGLLYSEFGRIYRFSYDYSKSLEAYRKAAECYGQVGKLRHRNYMLYNQSYICRNLNRLVESERLLQETLALAKEDADLNLMKLCIGDRVMLCIEESRMSEAQTLYSELKSLAGEDYGSSSFMGKLAIMYASEKNFPLADRCLQKGWKLAESKTDSVNLYLASAEVHSFQSNGKVSYQEMMKGVTMQNESVRQVLRQPVLTSQRDYLSEKLELEVYRNRMGKLLTLVSVLLFLLLFVVLVYVFVRLFRKYRKKSRMVIGHLRSERHKLEEERGRIALAFERLNEDKKRSDLTVSMLRMEIDRNKEESNAKIADLAQKEDSHRKMKELIMRLENDRKSDAESMERLRSEIESLESKYRLYVQKTEDLQNETHRIMFQKVELLKLILDQAVQLVLLYDGKYVKEETRKKKIKETVDLLKKDYYAGTAEYRKVEALVNRYLDNVMQHFRDEVILSDESEYRRVCYMFAGLSGQVIGEIMSESKDVVYQRRSRLLKKIGSLSCAHKDVFIMLLHKRL